MKERRKTGHKIRKWVVLLLAAVLTLLLGLAATKRSDVAPALNLQAQHAKAPKHLFTPKFSSSTDSKVLNVHVVPHTHDDVGWLKTVEQYFYGRNNSIQRAFVQSILGTTIQALLENPNRTFTYVEQKFFSMWWHQLNEVAKEEVRSLVHSSNQLSFVNGGWCMHDEAATHFVGMIDQTTLGHAFLKGELNYTPTVGWQLDPFGHSATQASYMSSKMGFDALYFGRIDYQDLELRQETQECEGLWSSSPNLQDEVVFWGLTGEARGTYGPPEGFCFDILCGDYRSDLTGMNETELSAKLKTFFDDLGVQANRTKGNQIMLTMGEDFNYEIAPMNFANMDLLIHETYQYQKSELVNVSELFRGRFDSVEIFYSSPNYYTECKHRETNIHWKTKTDDFMPYADNFHAYWTGYFVSRAGFKRLERVGSSFLMAARQIEAHSQKNGSIHQDSPWDGPLHELEDAMGVVQHHDAVTGTAKQHVADDYARRVQSGISSVTSFLTSQLRSIFLGDADVDEDYLANMMYCQFLNETSCEVSEVASASQDNVILIVYNGLARTRQTTVGIPLRVASGYNFHRLDSYNAMSDPVPSTAILREDGKYTYYFDTGDLPPAGAVAFLVSYNGGSLAGAGDEPTPKGLQSITQDPTYTVTKGSMSIQVDTSTGVLQKISNSKTGASVAVNQTWGYYTSYSSANNKANNTNPKQNSGAYIFRPQNPTEGLTLLNPKAGSASIIESDVVAEVHVQYEEPWIEQIIRLYASEEYVEVDYKVLSIPVDNGIGKEVVTRFSTDIVNHGTFYSDSNGREFQQRIRGHRPTWNLTEDEPIAGNYYPVNAALYIEDTNKSLGILSDRSQGGSSIVDGSLEIMVHRRILHDDSRGVGEAMNETTGGVTSYPPYGNAERVGEGITVGGRHRLVVGNGFEGASIVRKEMDASFSDPLVFAASSSHSKVVPMKRGSFSLLKESLPWNVMLLTFSLLHGKPQRTFLVRVAHQYGRGETDDGRSQPVKFCMGDLFPGASITKITEMTLSGNQDYDTWKDRKMIWGTSSAGHRNRRRGLIMCRDDCCEVELEPMDIRTFEVQAGGACGDEVGTIALA